MREFSNRKEHRGCAKKRMVVVCISFASFAPALCSLRLKKISANQSNQRHLCAVFKLNYAHERLHFF
jgi:hypothetical protein